MKIYFSNVPKSSVGSHSIEQPVQTSNANTLSDNFELMSNLDEIEINQDDIVSDPGLRKPIESFNVNIRDRIRREYAENEIFDSINNELILNRFQNMDSGRNQLSHSTKHSVA